MPRPAPQTDRLIALFRLLAARPQHGATMAEIARRIGVNRANLYPMMAALVEAGWLLHDPERKLYSLGPALVGLGDAASAGQPTLAALRPVALSLSEQTGLSSAVFTRSGPTVTLAELVWDLHAGAAPMRLGQSFPLRAPFGAGFVAWAGEAEIDRWLEAGSGDRAHLVDALGAIRERGFVVEAGRPPDDPIDAPAPSGGEEAAREARLSDRGAEALIEDLSRQSDSVLAELSASRRYRVRTLGAPVFDPAGVVTTFVVLFGFVDPVSGRDIHELGQLVCQETGRVTHGACAGSSHRLSPRSAESAHQSNGGRRDCHLHH